MSIPIGFRFEPTEEELVRGFLFPKVTGAPLPWDCIADRDVYGPNAEPWVVFSDADDDSSPHWTTKKEGSAVKKTIYVFTRVAKASSKSKSARNSRIAGCGTWSGQSGPKDIKHSDTGAVIGCSRMLAFECSKKDSAAEKKKKKELGHWIMHEYCLDGEGLRAAGIETTDLVLCKITKCVKKDSDRRRPIQPAAACLPAEGNEIWSGASLKKRSGDQELLEEEGCMKKHKSSSFNHNGDEEFNMEGDFDFDFDFEYGNIDMQSLLVEFGC